VAKIADDRSQWGDSRTIHQSNITISPSQCWGTTAADRSGWGGGCSSGSSGVEGDVVVDKV
jgi:hypothetical protein